MGRYTAEAIVKPLSSPHADYERNLRDAQAFCRKEDTGTHRLNGLRVKIGDGEHIKKALLMISWCPGMHVKQGNYATPVSLHQFNDEFKKTTTSILIWYKKSISDYDQKNPEQRTFFSPDSKV